MGAQALDLGCWVPILAWRSSCQSTDGVMAVRSKRETRVEGCAVPHGLSAVRGSCTVSTPSHSAVPVPRPPPVPCPWGPSSATPSRFADLLPPHPEIGFWLQFSTNRRAFVLNS